MSARWEASPRRRRRNVLLLAGLLPTIMALVVATALLVMLARQSSGVAASQRGDHDLARERFAANRWFGTVERWVAPYNEGVATFRDGSYGDALADFQVALRDVPHEHECLVLHNIAVTRERLGDVEARRDADDAMDEYRAGREVLADGPCLDPQVDDVIEDDPEAATAEEGGSPEDLTEGLTSATTRLDAELVEKIQELLASREETERAALSPREREAADRLEEVESRAAEREQRARARASAGSGSQSEPPDETYGW